MFGKMTTLLFAIAFVGTSAAATPDIAAIASKAVTQQGNTVQFVGEGTWRPVVKQLSFTRNPHLTCSTPIITCLFVVTDNGIVAGQWSDQKKAFEVTAKIGYAQFMSASFEDFGNSPGIKLRMNNASYISFVLNRGEPASNAAIAKAVDFIQQQVKANGKS